MGFLALLTALAGCMALIFLSIRFKAAIPSEYVPQYNIFDMQFYLGKIKEAIYAANSSYGLKLTELELYYKNTMILKIVVSILFIIYFLLLLSAAKLADCVGLPGYKLRRAFVISLPAAFIISIAFSLICGIKFVVPAGILILCCFLLLKLPKPFFAV